MSVWYTFRRQWGLLPTWHPKNRSRRQRPLWLTRGRWRKFLRDDRKDYWKEHLLWNLTDRKHGKKPQWRHMWRRRS